MQKILSKLQEIFFQVIHYIKVAFIMFSENSINLLPAHIAFFTMWSIIPIMIIWNLLKVIPVFNAAFDYDVDILTDNLAIADYVDISLSSSNIILIIVIFYLASKAFLSIIEASNYIYEFSEHTNFLKLRFKSLIFAVMLLVTFVLLLVISVLGSGILDLADNVFSDKFMLKTINFLRWPVTMLYLFGVLLFIYRFSPSKRVKFKYFLPGTIFTAISWIIVSFVYSLYVTSFADYTKIYSGFSSVILLMIWLYLISYLLIIGLVINATYFKESYGETS